MIPTLVHGPNGLATATTSVRDGDLRLVLTVGHLFGEPDKLDDVRPRVRLGQSGPEVGARLDQLRHAAHDRYANAPLDAALLVLTDYAEVRGRLRRRSKAQPPERLHFDRQPERSGSVTPLEHPTSLSIGHSYDGLWAVSFAKAPVEGESGTLLWDEDDRAAGVLLGLENDPPHRALVAPVAHIVNLLGSVRMAAFFEI